MYVCVCIYIYTHTHIYAAEPLVLKPSSFEFEIAIDI